MPEVIDKQEALKKMCEMCGYCEDLKKSIPHIRSSYQDFVIDKCNSYKFLSELPTIEAEPVRHGRWIVHTTWHGMFGLVHSECSECKFDRNGDLSSWNFCPGCGAKMDGRVTD